MQEAAEVGDVDKAIGDGRGRNGAADLVEVPDATALGDVAALGGVDGVEVPDAFAVLGILAVGDVDAVLEDHRRCDHLVARSRPDGILRIGVELPQLLAGSCFVAANPAVALRGDDLHNAADRAHSGRRPLAVQNAVLDRVVFPDQLAVVLVQRDDRGARGEGTLTWLSSWPLEVLTKSDVTPHDRRGIRQVVRIRADLLHHVERPDDIGIDLRRELFVFARAVVFVVAEALNIEAEDNTAVADVVEPFSFDEWREATP